jgi:hypothetical protein
MTDKPRVPEPVLISWQKDVADHDFKAAENYLSLKLPDAEVAEAITSLKKVKVTERRANDILRAAGLDALPLSDPGVLRDLKKVLSGEKLSPVLVARQDIADGYHRVSLAYALNPFGVVPLRIAGV